MMDKLHKQIFDHLNAGNRIMLFLDYDGTLAEFTPTPDVVEVRRDVIQLVEKLTRHPQLFVSVVTGRPLHQIRKLLPFQGLVLAGNYGIEMLLKSGEEIKRVEYQSIRSILDRFKPHWEAAIEGKSGFFIEDKGYSIAMHSKNASAEDASKVLRRLRELTRQYEFDIPYRITDGARFFEISSTMADKGEAVHYIIDRFGESGDLIIYIGDDDRDEEAFSVIKEHNGYTISVGSRLAETAADNNFLRIIDVHNWLDSLGDFVYNKPGQE